MGLNVWQWQPFFYTWKFGKWNMWLCLVPIGGTGIIVAAMIIVAMLYGDLN